MVRDETKMLRKTRHIASLGRNRPPVYAPCADAPRFVSVLEDGPGLGWQFELLRVLRLTLLLRNC